MVEMTEVTMVAAAAAVVWVVVTADPVVDEALVVAEGDETVDHCAQHRKREVRRCGQ